MCCKKFRACADAASRPSLCRSATKIDDNRLRQFLNRQIKWSRPVFTSDGNLMRAHYWKLWLVGPHSLDYRLTISKDKPPPFHPEPMFIAPSQLTAYTNFWKRLEPSKITKFFYKKAKCDECGQTSVNCSCGGRRDVYYRRKLSPYYLTRSISMLTGVPYPSLDIIFLDEYVAGMNLLIKLLIHLYKSEMRKSGKKSKTK